MNDSGFPGSFIAIPPGSDRAGARPALSLCGISKRFGATTALQEVDFSIRPGEIHALLGENGAGKSTLMHLGFGMLAPDAGTIRVAGEVVRLRSPRDARRYRIGMVHQHFTSIDFLSTRENVELAVGRRLDRSFTWDAGLLQGIDPNRRTGDLPVALRQRLEIAKALAAGAEVLLLDEPSAVLAPSEVLELLGLVRAFAAKGGAIALITHKLPEVFAAADRVTVLRKGRVTLHGSVKEQTESTLARAMIGEADLPRRAVGVTPTPQLRGDPLIRIGAVEIHAGELVGLAAIEGQGHRELLRRIANTDGVVLVPEDRTTEGLIPEMTLTENLVLGRDDDPRWRRGFRLQWSAARAHATAVIEAYQITAGGPDVFAMSLSGGNQQRVMIARALESRPRVLVVENPFRGLDLRAITAIRDRLRSAAEQGIAVLVYSTDLDEVIDLAGRMLVVRNHEVREAPRGADRQVIGRLMLGLSEGDA